MPLQHPLESSSSETGTTAGEVVADRYRIEGELGHGGMARVYRALDERSGRRVALKRLTVHADNATTLQAMFEREYHTLVELVHPHIVRAFEYGIDGEQPYYTMELLDGADVRASFRGAGRGVRESGILLRDVASALALVHSRRFVHRDVSPRNVWCLPDGRAKLIDFGTLVAMGPQTRAAGTAPFVPPEAVHRQPLDARCDIYALGALAYYMLTGRYAYPAREISELRHVWQSVPRRPDALVAEVPRALSDLVMAMLSLDARARPASAAEVVERLTAACDLPVDDERQHAQAFLASPKLVGREQESGALRKRLLRAIRGRGGAVAVVAPSGLGRSRMLSSLLVEAKLVGAAAIGVDASAVGSGSFALAAALAERLLEQLPMAAAAAVDVAPVLANLSPAVRRALGEPPLAPLTGYDRALKLSAALLVLFEATTRSQRVVIAVDDVQRADSASLGVLGRLSLLAVEHHLLLVCSCDHAALAAPPPVLEQLCDAKQRIELGPLAPEQTRELLASLFGEVPNLEDAARWLHELSHGSPQTCMQYAQYLVDHGFARYEGGTWELPARLREQPLPSSLGAMFDARIAGLSEDARGLALALSLARDETRAAWQPEIHVRIEDHAKLIAGDGARAFRARGELLRIGFVEQRDDYYVLGQRAMTDALLRASDEPARKLAHARLAEVLLQPGYHTGFLALQHLQRAGEHLRARQLIAESAARSAASNPSDGYSWGAMRLSVLSECTTAALAHYHEHGGSALEGVQLRRFLMAACAVYDWSNARVGDAQVAQLRIDCGLIYWDDTDASAAPLARVLECFKRAQEAYEQKPEAERGFAPLDAVKELSAVSIGLSSAYMHMHDVARARANATIIEPLRPLSPVVGLLADVSELAMARVRGLELGDRTLTNAQQLSATASLPDILRTGLSVIQLHMQVVEDARRGRARAVEQMDLLASLTGNDLFYIVHGRWLGYAFGGKSKLAEPLRKQIELITEDDVWRRKAFLFAEAQLHALRGDLPGLRRTSDAIAELASKFEGWRPWLSWCRAQVHALRGDLAKADEQLRAALAEAAPGEHRAWIVVAPAHAELLLARGDPRAALERARAIVEQAHALGLDRSAAVSGERIRALAESKLADHGAARASLARAFGLAHELAYDGLPLAKLYEANAAIALAAGETAQCAAALQHLWRLIEHADAPALFQAYEGFREASGEAALTGDLVTRVVLTRDSLTIAHEPFTDIQARLSAFDSRQQRADHALQLLVDEVGSVAGHLFLFDAGGPFAAATRGREEPGEGLLAAVTNYLQAELRETKTVLLTSSDVETTADCGMIVDRGTRLAPVLLISRNSGRSELAAIALLAIGDVPLRALRPELAAAIARCLLTAGDSSALICEDA